MRQIYLDYNASTPIAPEVVDAMYPYLKGSYGNPSSSHWASAGVKEAIQTARANVAALLNCDPDEIVFTSGGSESNNHALKGVYYALKEKGNHIITTTVEHPAILNPCSFLERLGAEVTYVEVDETGCVSPEAIEAAITDQTILITVMHANNEVGSIQPLRDIAQIAAKHNIVFHTDAAQSAGKIPVHVDELGVDLLSVAGHKLYAPKGIGALYVRRGTLIESFTHGAGHERGMRAGTENVPYIVALGKAAELAMQAQEGQSLQILGQYLLEQLYARFGSLVQLNGSPVNRLPNTVNVSFVGYDGNNILSKIPQVAASTGSACHAGLTTISPVLKAMQVDESTARGAIRFSVGRYTKKEELDEALLLLEKAISEN
ncbi:cysteine desulfurase family protein [Paenibacillus radicis (ex Gao et al. 2016)]|uniref:cysteine desulfurase n=1 Tax=Paenibacillus radicis (ex Gao et al. 2016) TaxID=1737354 RepID=A0A917H602_9BACL|nr:cysteine desulfurase family protein [Paenibacillus radicis (ex Gao et al. 2016)]GGG68563.1 cysteine desulfurase [Paenibacillus radicis (ex Gao et al. 2016)]